MSLLAPVLTGIIGKQVASGGLNLSGIQSLLKDQDQHIKDVIGEGILDKLGFGGLIGGLGSTVFGAGDKISGFAAGAGDLVSEAVGSVGDKVTDITEAASDTVTGAIGSVGDKVSGVSGAAGDAIKGVGDKAGAVVGAAGDKVTDTVSAVGDKAGAVVGSAGEKVSDAVGSVGDKAGAVVGSVGDKVSGAVGSAGSAAHTTKKGGKGLLALIPLLLLGALAFFLFKQCNPVAKVTDAVEGAAGAVGDAANAVADGAADISSAAVDGVADAGSAIAEGANAAVDSAKDLGNAALEGVADAGDAITDGAASLGEGAKDLGKSALDILKGAGGAVAEGADAVVESAKGTGEAVAEGAKKITTAEDPGLSEKVKMFADKLKGINPSDENALDQVYADFTADGSSSFLYRIPFQTGETGVPKPHQEALIAKLKTANPNATLVTIGYADVRGDDAANKKLSYGRAQEVGAWIKSTLGTDTNIESFSMGETDRFSKSDYSKNRVVEVWQVAK